MAIFDEYQQRAQAIHKEFKTAKAAVEADKMLSPEGKRQKIAALQQQRSDKVLVLQNEAQTNLKSKRGGAEKLLQLESEKVLESRIKLFGREGVLSMIRHSLETMDSPAIAEAYTTAATDFEREAIAGFGLPLLQMRARSAPTGETLMALQTLNQAEPKEVVEAKAWMRDVDDAIKRLDELDVEAHNAYLADRLGVDERYIEE